MFSFLKNALNNKKTEKKYLKGSSSGKDENLISNSYKESELVIGLVGAVGTDLDKVSEIIINRLSIFKYKTHKIRISQDILRKITEIKETKPGYNYIFESMEAGNKLRKKSGDNSFFALCSAAMINSIRSKTESDPEGLKPLNRNSFIIHSLKHPDEVERLKNIYSSGFFLIGVHSDDNKRENYLRENIGMKKEEARKIMEKDYSEAEGHGQHTSDTFHLSDFFVSDDGDHTKLERSLWRIIDLIFGNPFITPTFDEYAMFMAFASSLRSSDLSRQVGAVVAADSNILSTGANDVPAPGGGLYWPTFSEQEKKVTDAPNGRDYVRGNDSNSMEKQRIIEEITDAISEIETFPKDTISRIAAAISNTGIKDITEYGRVVHAEMDALLSCSRNRSSTRGATLYCTTFPCHNCAKHIVASGIERVVYVQPYSKSKALDFHQDSIVHQSDGGKEERNLVKFEPFIGIGPRSFFNLFSMDIGSGYPIKRKDSSGKAKFWSRESSRLRMQLLPCSYIEREKLASDIAERLLEKTHGKDK